MIKFLSVFFTFILFSTTSLSNTTITKICRCSNPSTGPSLCILPLSETYIKLNYEERQEFYEYWKKDIFLILSKIPNLTSEEKNWIETEMLSAEYSRMMNVISSKEYNQDKAKTSLVDMHNKLTQLHDSVLKEVDEDKRVNYEKNILLTLAITLSNGSFFNSLNEISKHGILDSENYSENLSAHYSLCMSSVKDLIFLSLSINN